VRGLAAAPLRDRRCATPPDVIRFLHTADWQLGLKLAFIAGDRGAYARAERFEVVRRIATVARERGVHAVVVAGDVFDDNAVGPDAIQRARDVLEEFAPLPVLLLPGNHDAGGPDCVLRRLGAGRHVRPLLDRIPVDIAGARFYPSPLLRRHERDDPTNELPSRSPSDPIRVAIAHGGLLDFGESESHNRIDYPTVLAKGFDYLALGDWHGMLRFGPRVWYPGAPEATRFKEKLPGNVLVVEIDEPGGVPRVEPVEVQRTRWVERHDTLDDDEHVEALATWFDRLERRSMALVELTLTGSLSPRARVRLEALLDKQRQELLFLRVDLDGLHDRASGDDFERLVGDGIVGRAAAELRAAGTREAEDALRMLYRFAVEQGGES
jgi:DNA repair exonuclease SbcCD nuclease subunit